MINKTSVGVVLLVQLVEDGQGPAPTGQLTGDRDRGDGGPLVPGHEPGPLTVQPAVPRIAAGPG